MFAFLPFLHLYIKVSKKGDKIIKDVKLIKLAQSGDSAAFDKLTNEYRDKVFALTAKYCKLEEDKKISSKRLSFKPGKT